jgi:hypothetical protein
MQFVYLIGREECDCVEAQRWKNDGWLPLRPVKTAREH